MKVLFKLEQSNSHRDIVTRGAWVNILGFVRVLDLSCLLDFAQLFILQRSHKKKPTVQAVRLDARSAPAPLEKIAAVDFINEAS